MLAHPYRDWCKSTSKKLRDEAEAKAPDAQEGGSPQRNYEFAMDSWDGSLSLDHVPCAPHVGQSNAASIIVRRHGALEVTMFISLEVNAYTSRIALTWEEADRA